MGRSDGWNVVFRADASLRIGNGHVMRGLVLADLLADAGARCLFVCRTHEGHLAAAITERGHRVRLLPAPDGTASLNDGTAHAAWLGVDQDTDALETIAAMGDARVDAVVVDHYGLDARWEKRVAAHTGRLLVIDDIADRQHHCDLLLDQNLGRTPADYTHLVPSGCPILAGPAYALLAPAFSAARGASLRGRAERQARHVMISLGGVDQHNVTTWALDALRTCVLPADIRFTVVMGRTAPWTGQVEAVAAAMPWPTDVRVDVKDMAALMAASDVAIGAAGSTSWERCCLGLPGVLMVLAENQRGISEALAAAGAVVVVDHRTAGAGVTFARSFERLVTDAAVRTAMSCAAAQVTDGLGASRVAACLLEQMGHA